MLRTTLLATTAIAASLLIVGCEQKTQQAQDKQDQTSDLAAQPAPTATERTAAEAANEIEQAAAPSAQITPAELAAGLNAKDVPNPAQTLSTAAVKTSDGQAVGEVRSVVVGSNGKADAVVVEVGGFLNVGERAVAIEATKFTYLKDRNILVAEVSKSDIEKMPAAPAQP
jgi:cytoskeletal protein RodZ